MGVKIKFKSGKEIDLASSTGFKENQSETFKNKDGSTYKAPGWVIFFGKGKKPIHYKKSSVVGTPDKY